MRPATDTDTDTDAAIAVSVEEAARLARVSVRTIRRWIQHGHLPYETRAGFKVISPADLPAARLAAGHGHGHGRGHDRDHGHPRPATAADTDTDTPDMAPANRQVEAEALVQRLLAPFIAEQTRLAEALGQERARADAAEGGRRVAEEERDALRLQLAEASVAPVVVVAAQDATETPPATIPTPTTPPGLWRRLRRALGRT